MGAAALRLEGWTAPFGDLAATLAALLWGTWHLIDLGWGRLLGPGHAASIDAYLPKGVVESVLWICLSISAGFVEEVVFRGYFQRQFTAWTGRPLFGLVLQALLFGVSHGYQGVDACMRITAYGTLIGAVALWRRSLAPGMIAHGMTDILAGIYRI